MILDKNSFVRNNVKLALKTLTTISIGSVTYHIVEGWNWLDSIYFSIITLTTVGYGDFSPQTNVGKIFTIFYIITGLGLMLTFINEMFDYKRNQE